VWVAINLRNQFQQTNKQAECGYQVEADKHISYYMNEKKLLVNFLNINGQGNNKFSNRDFQYNWNLFLKIF
jgi:hypothetical protein